MENGKAIIHQKASFHRISQKEHQKMWIHMKLPMLFRILSPELTVKPWKSKGTLPASHQSSFGGLAPTKTTPKNTSAPPKTITHI